LKKTESIDVLDAIGSNIRVDSRGSEVMRILPRVNEEVNEEWISDKTRFAYDGLKTQRLTVPMIKKDGEFQPASWEQALGMVAQRMKNVSGNEIAAIAGQLADAESLVALKDLLNRLGSENLHFEGITGFDSRGSFDFRSNYTLNSKIVGVEEADAILLIGTNPRHEAATLNARIRKAYLNGANIGLIGALPQLNYEFDHLGDSPNVIDNIFKQKAPFVKLLQTAKKPLVILGSSVFERTDAISVLSSVAKLVEKLEKNAQEGWSIYNVLQRVIF
jgi:NADH dehydrogenase (ubiquinone) Fe-S protein 1